MLRAFTSSLAKLKPKDPKHSKDTASPLIKLLSELIGRPRRPPAYVLAFECLEHMTSPYMALSKASVDFPAITQDYTVHKNLSLLHFSMIAQRFVKLDLGL